MTTTNICPEPLSLRLRRCALLIFLGYALPTSIVAAPADLDATFGADGKVLTDFGTDLDFSSESAFAITLQPDGKLVAAGFSTGDGFALARYNSDGTLDPSFGNNGKVITFLGVFTEAFALLLQPDAKLVVAGVFSGNFALARYNPDGTLDQAFGANGKVITDFPGYNTVRAVALQPDGKVVVAGDSDHGNVTYFALARYNSDGTLDLSFGQDGIVLTDVQGLVTAATALALQPDGKIVAAGYSEVAPISWTDFR